jgi:hypothetical protein
MRERQAGIGIIRGDQGKDVTEDKVATGAV